MGAARPRRLQGRMLFAAAVASILLLSLFLWRSSDHPIDSIGSSSIPKWSSSNDHSSEVSGNNAVEIEESELADYEDPQDHGAASGVTHPFSLSLPSWSSEPTSSSSPSSSSASTASKGQSDKGSAKNAESSPSSVNKFPPPSRPGNPVNWGSQKPRIDGKPNNLTISGFVFFGRRDRVEALHCYIEKNLVTNGGWLDNVIWVVNTKDEADVAFLNQVLARSPLYQTHVLEEQVWWPEYSKIWRIVNRDTMYVKIDDDVVWFAEDTIERLVVSKLKHPEALAVSANIINNPPLSFLHFHLGAHHPYFPDIPPNFDLNTLIPPPQEEEVVETVTVVETVVVTVPEESVEENHDDIIFGDKSSDESSSDQSSSSLSKRLATFGHKADWRPSTYPNWTGPDDFQWSLDYVPPPWQNHRWLRVPDDKALNRTPVARLTYDVWGPTYESWAIASQQHYSLLENIEKDQLDLYKFEKPWDMKGERIRINFLAVMGDDIVDSDVFNWPEDQGDEDMLVLTLPHDLGRPVLIEGTALAAHFNFMHQGGVTTTDLLARYQALSAEKACISPGPKANI